MFVSKDMQTLPTYVDHARQDQSHSLIKIHVNVKVLQFLMKTLSDVFNFSNVNKTQLESFKVEFTDASAILTFISMLISVSSVQLLPYGILLL